MKFFMIEWWNEGAGKYNQEYFVHFSAAAARFIDLQTDVPGSTPEITTLHMEDSSV